MAAKTAVWIFFVAMCRSRNEKNFRESSKSGFYFHDGGLINPLLFTNLPTTAHFGSSRERCEDIPAVCVCGDDNLHPTTCFVLFQLICVRLALGY